MTVNDFYCEILGAYIFVCFKVYNSSFVVGIKLFFAHNAFAHGGHLRTALRIYDCGHNVAAECGTNLIKKVLIFLACFRVGVVSDFRAVQSAVRPL